MRLYIVWISLLSTFFCSYTSSAFVTQVRHYEYRHLSGTTWILGAYGFRNCDSYAPFAPFATSARYYDTCMFPNKIAFGTIGSNKPIIMPNGKLQYSKSYNDFCPGVITYCDSPFTNSNLLSFYEFYAEDTITLPEVCGYWNFSIGSPSSSYWRDTVANNVVDFYTVYAEAILNADTTIKNNSALWRSPMFAYSSEGQATQWYLDVYDPDGDSLAISLVHVRERDKHYPNPGDTLIQDIPFVSPYSLSEPFNTGGTWQFDPSVPCVRFTGGAGQIAWLCFKVEEYRNGVFVGATFRDHIWMTIPSSQPLPVRTTESSTLLNAVVGSNDTITVCAGSPMQLCSYYHSSSPAALLRHSSNVATALPAGASYTLSGSGDSLYTCLQWTPTTADTGYYLLRVTITDTLCGSTPGPRIPQDFFYKIMLRPTLSLPNDTALCAGTNLPVTLPLASQVLWSGGAYTCVNPPLCSSVVLTPTATSNYVASLANPVAACQSVDTMRVAMVQDFSVSVSDTTLCQAVNNVFLSAQVAGVNQGYRYSWQPTSSIVGSNADSSLVSVQPIAGATTYTVTVRDSLSCFVHSDVATLLYDVELPTVSLSAEELCAGDTLMLNIQSSAALSSVLSPMWAATQLTPKQYALYPDATTNYTLSITRTPSGCMSDTAFTLPVYILRADAGADQLIYAGAAVKLGGDAMQAPTGTKVTWLPVSGLNNPTLLYPLASSTHKTSYILTLSSPQGNCISSDTVVVSLRCDKLFLPTAIYPESDIVVNRSFGLSGQLASLRYLKIYNRRGQEVYFSTDVNQRWDASYKGQPVPIDTYYYVLEGACEDGTTVFKKGDVMVVR